MILFFKNIKQKNYAFYLTLILIGLMIFSCGSDDDATADPQEFNECETYEPTLASGTFEGRWDEANEHDVYNISIPGDVGGGYVKVSLTQGNPGLIPALFVDNNLDAGGTIIGGSAAQTNNTSARIAYFSVHPNSTFSVEVYPFVNAPMYPADYNLEWEFFSKVDCFEQNDTQAQAKKILFDETIEAYAIAGYTDYFIDAFDDRTYDWYKVNLDEPGIIESEVLDMPNDMRITMRFFDASGSVVASNFEWFGAETDLNRGRLSKITSSSILQPGTYYIELHSDFVLSRKSNSDLEPIPEHFNKTYVIKTKKQL